MEGNKIFLQIFSFVEDYPASATFLDVKNIWQELPTHTTHSSIEIAAIHQNSGTPQIYLHKLDALQEPWFVVYKYV